MKQVKKKNRNHFKWRNQFNRAAALIRGRLLKYAEANPLIIKETLNDKS